MFLKLFRNSFIFILFFTVSCVSTVDDYKTVINTNEDIESIDIVKLHPLFKEPFKCSEHWEGQFTSLGDALGADCIIEDWYKDDKRLFMRSFKNQGFENTDWFGYQKDVLSPCDCVIVSIHINPVTNQPGIMQPGRASSVLLSRADGVFVLIAHIDSPFVEVGQSVQMGEKIALVGNNGYSRNPHIHVAAWLEQMPLQIRFDQKFLGLKFREANR